MTKRDCVAGNSTVSMLRHDLLASVVVFLVALPLCMGIAMASGMPPGAGLVTGIVGGLVAGVFAGCPLQVSGPAAGLSVIVWQLVQTYGPGRLGLIVLLAGSLQLAAGILRLGQVFRAVAPAVIEGMLAGIGALILVSQFHIMVDDVPKGNGLANLLTIPEALYKGLVPHEDTTHDEAAQIGMLTILSLVVWKSSAPTRLKIVPAPLVAIVMATAATHLLALPIQRVQMPESLMTNVRWPDQSWASALAEWKTVLFSAATVAFIASAETLLCAGAVDQMQTASRTNYDRELAAQGIGNILCGVLGALPMTGVIVRSAANIEAGARTRAATILHGFWLLLFVSLAPCVLQLIPTAGLAAILVFTGYKLINIQAIRELRRFGKGEVMIYAVTFATIVATDLLTGVAVGMGLSIAKLVHAVSHLSICVSTEANTSPIIVRLRGAATFVRLPKLAAALEQLPPNAELQIQVDELTFIDHACLDYMMNWEKQHEASGGSLSIDWDGLLAKFRPHRRPRSKDQLQLPSGNGHTAPSPASNGKDKDAAGHSTMPVG